MPPVLLAHAEGEDAQVEPVAAALAAAGYDVVYDGTVLVGESLVQEASAALAAGSPVVLCGTVAAMGTGWAHQVVNAARAYPGMHVFALQMEKQAYLLPLALDGRIADYWQDPGKAIADLLDALREYYPPQAAPRRKADDALRRYCDLALRTNDIVDLANLPVTDRNLAARELLLRSLYVGLRVSIDPATAGPQQFDLDEMAERTKRWSVGELLGRSQRLVVLGDPGAGKSTLLRWLATAYLLRQTAHPDWLELPDIGELPDSDWLPILVRCRDLDTQAATSLEQMLDHHLRKLGIAGSDTNDLNDLLRSRLEAGNAILLVDGLDEITQPAARASFCRQIEQIHVTVPAAAIIATSRVVGYREMGLRIGRGFEHATVLDLTGQDKDKFVAKWCMLTEPPTRREVAAEELTKDIHSTDRIERLTGNPMLLTTMALVKKKVGKLPSRRADLYREAVDVLLNWRSDVDEVMDPREALPQLEYLGYAMCQAGVQQLRADQIIALLARMRREFSRVRAVRRHQPEEFLELLERRTGILVEIGKVRHHGQLIPAYEFRHLTFQEYLAGLALVEGRFPGRVQSRSLAENVSRLAAQTSSGAPDSADLTVSENWREALRLCVMSCNDDDVDAVLLALASPREDEDAQRTARPRAALAISCLADEPNVSEQVAIDLIDRFARVLRPTDMDVPGPIGTQTLDEVASSLWAPVVSRRFVTKWLSTTDDSIWLAECAYRAAGRLIPYDAAALRGWLIQQVQALSSSDRVDRVGAALATMRAAHAKRNSWIVGRFPMVPRLRTELMKMLKRSGCEATAAAWAIAWLTEQGAGDAIWRLTTKQQADLVSLMKNQQTPGLAACFLAWGLSGDYSDDQAFARAMSARLANSEPPLTEALIPVYQDLFPAYAEPIVPLLDHGSPDVQMAAIDILARLDDTRAIEPLIRALPTAKGKLRYAVIDALANQTVTDDDRPLRALQDLMHGPDRADRQAAFQALVERDDNVQYRILLSRDANGGPPTIDVDHQITDKDVRRYAKATGLTPSQVRDAYEELQAKYGLRLAWQSPETPAPSQAK